MTESSASVSSASDSGALEPQEAPRVLGAQDVDLWLCRRDHVASSDEFKRGVLAGYTGVKPLDLQFAQSEMGKPYLLGAASTLDFNLSHSGDWLACAVTAGTRVGVDLEFCKAGREVMRLVNRFFRPEEIAALQSLDGADQRDRFYDFWTLKESAIKARGETLGPGLESRGFELTFRDSGNYEPGRIAVTTPAVEATAQYCLLSPLPAYRLAVCWLPTVYLRPRLQVFRIGESGETGQLALPLRASSWFD